jgi:ComF family protein
MANNFLLDLLFPKCCVSCGKIGFYICQKCQKEICFLENQVCYRCGQPSLDGLTHPVCKRVFDLDGVLSFAYLSGPTQTAIHKLKYKLISDLAWELVDLVFSNRNLSLIPESIVNKDFVLIPVPLHPKREKWRGFNQAEVLAKIFSKKFDLEMGKNILERTKNTKAQVDLPAKARRRNVQGAFSCFNKRLVKDRNFLLVDDMITTGATLANCASALKRTGASSVWALTLARSAK